MLSEALKGSLPNSQEINAEDDLINDQSKSEVEDFIRLLQLLQALHVEEVLESMYLMESIYCKLQSKSIKQYSMGAAEVDVHDIVLRLLSDMQPAPTKVKISMTKMILGLCKVFNVNLEMSQLVKLLIYSINGRNLTFDLSGIEQVYRLALTLSFNESNFCSKDLDLNTLVDLTAKALLTTKSTSDFKALTSAFVDFLEKRNLYSPIQMCLCLVDIISDLEQNGHRTLISNLHVIKQDIIQMISKTIKSHSTLRRESDDDLVKLFMKVIRFPASLNGAKSLQILISKLLSAPSFNQLQIIWTSLKLEIITESTALTAFVRMLERAFVASETLIFPLLIDMILALDERGCTKASVEVSLIQSFWTKISKLSQTILQFDSISQALASSIQAQPNSRHLAQFIIDYIEHHNTTKNSINPIHKNVWINRPSTVISGINIKLDFPLKTAHQRRLLTHQPTKTYRLAPMTANIQTSRITQTQ